MPTFEYTAIDRQGNSVQGQVQANSRDEAALSLTRTGLLVSRLAQSNAPAAPSAPARTPSPASPMIQQSQSGRLLPGAPPVLNTGSATKAAPKAPIKAAQKKAVIRTKRGTDKDIYFLFSQLQSYARAGVNPVEYLTNLSQTFRREDYRQALAEAADAAKEGRPISDVFERYVDLFPPHVVGMIRAAEQGGFFPEAYDLITDQAQASHKFRIWFTWLLWVAIMVGACLPVMWVVLRGALNSWDAQEKAGGMAPGMGTFVSQVFRQLLWPCGPIIAGLVLFLYLFGKYWQALPRREMRHRMVLIVPSVAKRARAESLSVFAWTMSMLSRVGLPPKQIWDLSMATVPNLEMRRRFNETGNQMTEQTRLSEAMSMSRQMPEEYAPIVQTGEVTGDVPGALLRASQTQLEEFKAGDNASKMRVGCWMFLLMGAGSAILMMMYYGGFMSELMKKILGDN
ncbi:MAG TPA: type II secretion system F family protein [Fimbriimonadaceae bacterium]|nr:type II secretion system F family protein [Fimbriimonadaceae bacterium]